ncbi:MAG: porin, partial [Gammaproteobacteria bacterium]
AAVVLGGEDGWEVSYGGFINLFYNQHDFEYFGGGSEDSSHLNEGLLPNFHTMTVKTPEVNGLKGTGQITFAVDSSSNKDGRLNKAGVFNTGSTIDMREVFFNVEGDFGTISAGRTLSLFQRQAILKDMTLFGMGAMGGPDGGGTSLGRIGFGYVYPDFRTRFTYKTPDINGFNLEVGIFDPQEPLGAAPMWETDTPQFQAEATYTTPFEGGSFNVWAGLLWQEQTMMALNSDVESFGYNVGADVSFQGFNVVGSFYDGEALGSVLFNLGGGDGFVCGAIGCAEADNQGYYVQGSYTFNGKTKLGVSYGASRQDAVNNTTLAAIGAPLNSSGGQRNRLFTVGVYHDVTSWLKVIAEYNDYDSTFFGIQDAKGFSVGGFLLW